MIITLDKVRESEMKAIVEAFPNLFDEGATHDAEFNMLGRNLTLSQRSLYIWSVRKAKTLSLSLILMWLNLEILCLSGVWKIWL